MKGLTAYIYKHEGRSFANGGISDARDEVTIVGVTYDQKSVEPLDPIMQVSEPTEKAPPVVIVYRHLFGARIAQAQPAAIGPGDAVTLLRVAGSVGPMMGGTYIGTSDSRMRDLTGSFEPIALHDRFETTAQYATYD